MVFFSCHPMFPGYKQDYKATVVLNIWNMPGKRYTNKEIIERLNQLNLNTNKEIMEKLDIQPQLPEDVTPEPLGG